MVPELPNVQFLQIVVSYSILVCFLIPYQNIGQVLYWWSPQWQKPLHPLLHSSSVKFIHIRFLWLQWYALLDSNLKMKSLWIFPGPSIMPRKNNCNDALREKPSRWGTIRTKWCWRTPHPEDMGSPEAGGAVSLCHELHGNTAHSQWEAPLLE